MFIFIIHENINYIIVEYIASLHKKINNSKIIYYKNQAITINENDNYIFVGISYTNYPIFNFKNCYYMNLEQLTMDGINAGDVGRFWDSQPFNLELPNINGKTMHGNCDLCFLKPGAQILSLIQEKPEKAIWWAQMEKYGSEVASNPSGAVFRQDRPNYASMLQFTKEQEMMFDINEEAIACFCGD